jgi:hypothetical protein
MGNLIITTNQFISQNITIATIIVKMILSIVTVTLMVVQVMGTMEKNIFMDIGRHNQDHILNFTFDGTRTEGLAELYQL